MIQEALPEVPLKVHQEVQPGAHQEVAVLKATKIPVQRIILREAALQVGQELGNI